MVSSVYSILLLSLFSLYMYHVVFTTMKEQDKNFFFANKRACVLVRQSATNSRTYLKFY